MSDLLIKLCAVGALSCLVGCAGQADKTYRGEPLASLHGRVETTSTSAALPPLSAVLDWGRAAPNADGKVPERLGPNILSADHWHRLLDGDLDGPSASLEADAFPKAPASLEADALSEADAADAFPEADAALT